MTKKEGLVILLLLLLGGVIGGLLVAVFTPTKVVVAPNTRYADSVSLSVDRYKDSIDVEIGKIRDSLEQERLVVKKAYRNIAVKDWELKTLQDEIHNTNDSGRIAIINDILSRRKQARP